jgi:hypothetical protein
MLKGRRQVWIYACDCCGREIDEAQAVASTKVWPQLKRRSVHGCEVCTEELQRQIDWQDLPPGLQPPPHYGWPRGE